MAVFALNTVVGFACSLNVNMGFNSKHQDDEKATEAVVHIHKDGKKEKRSYDKNHQHNQSNTLHKSRNDKDNCCTDDVKQFQDLDKAVPNSLNIVHPVFPTAFAVTYYDLSLFSYTNVVKDIKPFVRSYHPPIPDIRIAVQSFQI